MCVRADRRGAGRGWGWGIWQQFFLTDAGPAQAPRWVLWKRTPGAWPEQVRGSSSSDRPRPH